MVDKDGGGGNRVSETQIKSYLMRLLGPDTPQPEVRRSPTSPEHKGCPVGGVIRGNHNNCYWTVILSLIPSDGPPEERS